MFCKWKFPGPEHTLLMKAKIKSTLLDLSISKKTYQHFTLHRSIILLLSARKRNNPCETDTQIRIPYSPPNSWKSKHLDKEWSYFSLKCDHSCSLSLPSSLTYRLGLWFQGWNQKSELWKSRKQQPQVLHILYIANTLPQLRTLL